MSPASSPVRGFALVVALALAACSSNRKQATLPRAQLGSPYARQTGYFAACGVGCQEERVPGDLRHDAIRDEATLVSAGPAETCFDVVVRAGSASDEPFDQLEPRCELDGARAPVVTARERVSVLDYGYTGEVETVQASAVAADRFLGLSLREPRDLVFRVVERRGRLCCPGAPVAAVELELHNPHDDLGVSDGLLTFAWRLAR